MPKLSDKALLTRDANRDLGRELADDLALLKRGVVGRVTTQDESGATRESSVFHARLKLKRSQAEFAKMIGVSVRTLQQWEQGRREPSGAAKALIEIAIREPRAVQRALAALA
jgi:putative transcriptional regulator